MDLDILNAYIASELSEENFFSEIKEEVLNFIAGINSASGTVQIIGSDSAIKEFGSRRLLSLFHKYLNGNFGEWELEYILRAIEFAYEEEDERVEKVVFSFSDPYLNYNINVGNIVMAINYLSGSAEKLILQKDKDEKLRINYQSIFYRESDI